MKLTELKEKIDEALKLHDDYDIKINYEEIDECGIDSGRFNFNIYVNDQIFGCDEYHIEEDEDMEYCNICSIYHSRDIKCSGCALKKYLSGK